MPFVLTAEQIAVALIIAGVPAAAITLKDNTYTAPKLEWLLGEFWDSHCAELAAQGLLPWAEDWDCDDFSEDLANSARKAHKARQRKDGKFYAESTGVLYFQTQVNQPGAVVGSHAFILAVQVDPATGNIFFVAIEPQPNAARRIYNLVREEYAAATGAR